MAIQFKTVGYDLTRKSVKQYTHAAIFVNVATKTDDNIGATFHTSLQAAEKNAKALSKRDHLFFVEIVEVVAA
jgi:hypothetical protein